MAIGRIGCIGMHPDLKIDEVGGSDLLQFKPETERRTHRSLKETRWRLPTSCKLLKEVRTAMPNEDALGLNKRTHCRVTVSCTLYSLL